MLVVSRVSASSVCTLLLATPCALRARSTPTYASATASLTSAVAAVTWAPTPRSRASAAAMLDEMRPLVNSGTVTVAEPIRKLSSCEQFGRRERQAGEREVERRRIVELRVGATHGERRPALRARRLRLEARGLGLVARRRERMILLQGQRPRIRQRFGARHADDGAGEYERDGPTQDHSARGHCFRASIPRVLRTYFS